jgi:hypothetical protein
MYSLFNDDLSNVNYVVLKDGMEAGNELWTMCMKTETDVLLHIFGRYWRKPRNIWVRVIEVLADVGTRHLERDS